MIQNQIMKKASAIVYHEYGNPVETVRVEELELPAPGSGEVLVEIKAAPINPADLNTIEGKYPVKPALPAVPGIEGVGIVSETGTEVALLKKGSLVKKGSVNHLSLFFPGFIDLRVR